MNCFCLIGRNTPPSTTSIYSMQNSESFIVFFFFCVTMASSRNRIGKHRALRVLIPPTCNIIGVPAGVEFILLSSGHPCRIQYYNGINRKYNHNSSTFRTLGSLPFNCAYKICRYLLGMRSIYPPTTIEDAYRAPTGWHIGILIHLQVLMQIFSFKYFIFSSVIKNTSSARRGGDWLAFISIHSWYAQM